MNPTSEILTNQQMVAKITKMIDAIIFKILASFEGILRCTKSRKLYNINTYLYRAEDCHSNQTLPL